MSEKAPTAKQLLRAIVVEWFPWLQHVKAIGQGLAILAAGGKIHIQGGPDSPAVHRVGDAGTAGTISASANILTITDAAGNIATYAFAYVAPNIVITPVPVLPFKVITKAETGSEKVTSG